MHNSALISGNAFAEAYGIKDGIVVDIGGRDVNGSLKSAFEDMKFICVDMEKDQSVDIVVQPSEKLPLEDESVDLIVSTSCFEHDPCFWMTFKEMCRIVKPTGYIYVNAPSAGPYHMYPGDNWRFYSDAGQALAYWSGKQISDEKIFPVKVIETFTIVNNEFNDFVCVWQRVDSDSENTVKEIIVQPEIINNIGILEKKINEKGFATRKKC
jgi:SAM-dependent methyltransferase